MPPVALLLGGSHGDVPLVRALHGRGLEVVVLGGDPEGQAHAMADRSVVVDYSDASAVLDVARTLAPALIVPGSNDFAAITAADVSAALGVPGGGDPAEARLFHRKDAFRDAARRAGIPVPTQFTAECPPGEGDWPVIVKPVDLTGGKGVGIAHGDTDLTRLRGESLRLSWVADLVVERFIEGTHHGVSAVLVDGEPCFTFIDDEYYRPGRFEVAAAATPSSLPYVVVAEVFAGIRRMAREWALVDGIIHLQLVVQDHAWFIIDTCRRIPGDLYVDLVRAATGVDYLAGLVAIWVGQSWVPPDRHDRPAARVCLESATPGLFEGVRHIARGGEELVSLTEITPRGEAVTAGQKVAIAILARPDGAGWGTLDDLESRFVVQIGEAHYQQ